MNGQLPGASIELTRDECLRLLCAFTVGRVLVRGTAFRTTAVDVERLDTRSWAAGDKQYWVRVVPDEITGRRLVAPDLIEGVVS